MVRLYTSQTSSRSSNNIRRVRLTNTNQACATFRPVLLDERLQPTHVDEQIVIALSRR